MKKPENEDEIKTFVQKKYPEVSNKYIRITDFHKTTYRSYLDSKVKRIAIWNVGIFGIISYVISFVYYFMFLEVYSIGIMFIYFIVLCYLLGFNSHFSIHRWNLQVYIILFFSVALFLQIVDIIMYILSPMSILKFVVLTLGNSWAPACLTIFVLYVTRDYVNLIGRIHLMLGWIYKLGTEKQNSYFIMDSAHLYMSKYLLELEDLLERKLNLVVTNIPEILTQFYTKMITNVFFLNSVVTENKNDFVTLCSKLHRQGIKKSFEGSMNEVISLLIKLTKKLTCIESIEFKYFTGVMKIKRVLRKSLKILIPAATSIASFIFKLVF